MVRGDLAAYLRELGGRYASLDPGLLAALAGRHGTRSPRILGSAVAAGDLGRHFGDTLFAAEIDYLIAQEWATSAEDILWRRTKCGLHMTPAEREAVSNFVRDRAGGVPKATP
jgi:glycerol-3-phosphate dehydrogenase